MLKGIKSATLTLRFTVAAEDGVLKLQPIFFSYQTPIKSISNSGEVRHKSDPSSNIGNQLYELKFIGDDGRTAILYVGGFNDCFYAGVSPENVLEYLQGSLRLDEAGSAGKEYAKVSGVSQEAFDKIAAIRDCSIA